LFVDLVRGEVEVGIGRAESSGAKFDSLTNFRMIGSGEYIYSPV